MVTPRRPQSSISPRLPNLSEGFNHGQFGGRKKQKVTPTDELYTRPSPNPFTESYCNGYDAGIQSVPPILGLNKPSDYWAGVEDGRRDKVDLDQIGSSNT